jgi:ubiquinone/menaquinone biosynthesis C-methylase UbiE
MRVRIARLAFLAALLASGPRNSDTDESNTYPNQFRRQFREREFRVAEESLQAGWELRGQFAARPHASCHTLPVTLANRLLGSPSREFFRKCWFRYVTHFRGTDDLVFINTGYEEDLPMDLPLEASDEPNRFCIQLYHRTATQVDLTGKRVLEVSCGHGGGASYLVRTLGPASYTGLDLNPAGVDLCRKRHKLPGLDFVQGNADNLPFPDQSFDAVINVQASFCYPSFPRFLAEVARVLRPGGHFLYADFRRRDGIAKWEEELRDAPMRLMSERIITEQVVRGLEKNLPRLQELSRHTPAFFVGRLNGRFCRRFQIGESTYRMYCFANE